MWVLTVITYINKIVRMFDMAVILAVSVLVGPTEGVPPLLELHRMSAGGVTSDATKFHFD